MEGNRVDGGALGGEVNEGENASKWRYTRVNGEENGIHGRIKTAEEGKGKDKKERESTRE